MISEKTYNEKVNDKYNELTTEKDFKQDAGQDRKIFYWRLAENLVRDEFEIDEYIY